MPILSRNSYGKSGVRLTKLDRDHPDGHSVCELEVEVELEGDFAAAYVGGDNSRVIATDSCRNAVYVLANDHPLANIESFARDLADHFVSAHAQVERAEISIRSTGWQRIRVGARTHPTAFLGAGAEEATCRASRARRCRVQLQAGIDALEVLKTAGSGFSGFSRDVYRTLPETDDRVLAARIRAEWCYAEPGSADADWSARRDAVRQAMLTAFAEHTSASLQQTLWVLGSAALDACPAAESIDLVLTHRHRLPVDLAPFGGESRNALFVPTDAPAGEIRGSVTRGP